MDRERLAQPQGLGRRRRTAPLPGGPGGGLVAEGPELSDGEVVRRVLAGETELFRILVERCRRDFGRYAASVAGDTDTANDAMQEAFIRAYDALATCRDPDRFKSWFFRILTNRCHTARSKRRREVALENPSMQAPDRTEHRVERRELREAIEAALETLTPEQREAFVLKEVEGRSYEAISELLGVGVDALKMRVYRARDALRTQLRGIT